MGVRDALRKAAGLLVELPPDDNKPQQEVFGAEQIKQPVNTDQARQQPGDEPPPASAARETAYDIEGVNLDEVTAFGPTLISAATPDGKVDFSVIYQQAALPKTAFTAEQVLEILSSQPPELPLETKRLMVRATLHAIERSVGATPETVSADASNKLAALDAYVGSISNQVADFVAKAEREIESLQAQVTKKRNEIELLQQQQKNLTQMCRAESARLNEVRIFFGLDVYPASKTEQTGEKK